jgi:hypothetical protein
MPTIKCATMIDDAMKCHSNASKNSIGLKIAAQVRLAGWIS